MKRREFIAFVVGASVSFSVGGNAQEVRRVPRIGFLWINTKTTAAIYLDALRRGLRDLGYEENKNLKIEQRYADGNAERLPILVGELIAAKVNVIVTASIPSALAAKNAATDIPIVVAA